MGTNHKPSKKRKANRRFAEARCYARLPELRKDLEAMRRLREKYKKLGKTQLYYDFANAAELLCARISYCEKMIGHNNQAQPPRTERVKQPET